MERIEGEVIVASIPDRARQPRAAPADRRGADRRARRDPRRRLARRGPRGLRQADRLPRAPAAALPRPVGAQQDPRDPGRGERRHLARREHARVRAGDDRPRRLPPRQHDLRRPGAGAAAAVLDWEMATIGDPLADLGYLCMMWTERGDPAGGLREHLGEVTRAEGFPDRGRADRPLRRALGPLDERHPLVHDARAVEERSSSWRATTSARSQARPTTRT